MLVVPLVNASIKVWKSARPSLRLSWTLLAASSLSSRTSLVTTPPTAASWHGTPKASALTPSPPSRRSISICRRMPSRTIGTPSLQLRQIRILSFIISRSSRASRSVRSFCRKWLRIRASSASKTRLCRRRTSRCGAMRPSVSSSCSTVRTSS